MLIGQFFYLPLTVLFLVTPLPEMIKQLELRFPSQSDRVSALASGVLNSFYGLGQMIGPLYGANFTQYFGFRN